MSRRKDEVLRRLSYEDLLQLAELASEKPVDNQASRSHLVKSIKESFSIEEIERRVKEIKHGKKGMRRVNEAETEKISLFQNTGSLKVGVLLLFIGLMAAQVFRWSYYTAYTVLELLVFGDVAKVVGLAMLTYWFLSSALRVGKVNHTAAAILALGGSILIIGVLICSMTVVYQPYSIWFS